MYIHQSLRGYDLPGAETYLGKPGSHASVQVLRAPVSCAREDLEKSGVTAEDFHGIFLSKGEISCMYMVHSLFLCFIHFPKIICTWSLLMVFYPFSRSQTVLTDEQLAHHSAWNIKVAMEKSGSKPDKK